MIVDTTQSKIECDIASILDGQITYSRQWGFFLTKAQKRAIFWEQMKEWKTKDLIYFDGEKDEQAT